MDERIVRMMRALALKERGLTTIRRSIAARAEALAVKQGAAGLGRGAPGWSEADEAAFKRSAAKLARERAGELRSLRRKIMRQRSALADALAAAGGLAPTGAR